MLKGESRRCGSPEITDFRGPNRRRIENPQTRITPTQSAELIAEYKAGASLRALAKQFGVHRNTAAEHVRRAGVGRERAQFTEAVVAQIVDQYQSGVGLDRIGSQWHTSSKRVRAVLVEAGVNIRAQKGGRIQRKDERAAKQ